MPKPVNLKKKTEEEKEKAYTRPQNSLPKKAKTPSKPEVNKVKIVKPSQQNKPKNASTDTATGAAKIIKQRVEGKSTQTQNNKVVDKKPQTPKYKVGGIAKQSKNTISKYTSSKQRQVSNRYSYKTTSSDKVTYKIGGEGAEKGGGRGKLEYPDSVRGIVGQPTNPNADTGKYMREQMRNGTQTIHQSGNRSQASLEKSNRNLQNNEKHQAYTSPQSRAVAQEVFATNPAAKFLGNMSETFLETSPIGLAYAGLTGESIGAEAARDNPDYYSKSHSGLSAGAGRLVGTGLGLRAGRMFVMDKYNNAAKTVMNSTKVGNMLKNSATVGKIGQKIGTQAAQNMVQNTIAETMADMTMGVGENALLAYGEGYRGKDWGKQVGIQTAQDLILGNIMGAASHGWNIHNINKALKAEPTDLLKYSNSKSSYLKELLNAEQENLTKGKEIGLNSLINKANQYRDEVNIIQEMSDADFIKYKNKITGKGAVDTAEEAVKATTKETPVKTESVKPETEAKAEPTKKDIKSKSTGKTAVSRKTETKGKWKGEEPEVDYTVTRVIEPEKAEAKSVDKVKVEKVNKDKGSVRYRDTSKKTTFDEPRALSAEEGARQADEDYWARFDAKPKKELPKVAKAKEKLGELSVSKTEEPTPNKAVLSRKNDLQSNKGVKTEARKPEERIISSAKEEASKILETPEKTISDKVKKALDGELDYKELSRKDVEIYAKELGEKIPRKTNGHRTNIEDIHKIIENHFNKPKAEAEAPKVKAKEKVPEAPKELPTEEITNPESLKTGDYIVDDRYGVGKIIGTDQNEWVGKTVKIQFADSEMQLAVNKGADHWKRYTGNEELELGKMGYKESSSSLINDLKENELARGEFAEEIKDKKRETWTSGNDSGEAFKVNSNGTYTIKNESPETPKELPRKKKLTRESGKKSLENVEKWKSENLPKKGEKVANDLPKKETPKTEAPKTEKPKTESANPSKPLTSESTGDDVASKWGESKKGKILNDLDETLSKYEDGETTKSFHTYMRSPEISDEAKKIMQEMRDNNEAFIKKTITNKQVLEEAERKASNNIDELYNTFMSNAKTGRQATSQDQADALILVKNLIERGEMSKAAKVNAELSAMATENARFLQAQRIWNALTPEGRVRSTLSAIRRLEKSRGMSVGSIEIGEEGEKLLKAIYDAETNGEIAKANKEFSKYIWNQIPATFAEKCNAWRYLAMLANPKTHIRNILGNALFQPARITSNAIAAGLEKTLSKRIKKLGGEGGTHAILNFASKEDRALYKKAGESFKDDRELMESISSKFFEKQRPIESPTFNTKIMQFLEKLNSTGLEKEDEMFMGLTYRSAFAQYCKAHGIKASEITEEIARKASNYAQEEALKATYRDSNELADALNRLRRRLDPKKSDTGLMKIGKKSAGFLMDSTVPFVKTPLNILKQGAIEYTPWRALHGLAKIATAKDADSLVKGIEYLSTGLTGSGVMALGWWLSSKGYINGSMGEYNKKYAYDQMLGKQDYAVTLPEGTSVTLDWVAPMSMPFFVGVEIASLLGEERASDTTLVSAAFNAMSNIADPIFEMSMLQGVENVFNTAFSEKQGLSTIAKNAGANYLSQFVPTLFGQIARTKTDNRKTVLSTSTDPLQKEIEKQFGKIINKIPIANEILSQDYVDQWGRTEKSSSGWENFFSPAYLKTKNETTVDTEIQRLYKALDEENKDSVIPSVNSNAYKQKFEDKEYTMTPAEFTQYKKTVGQAKFNGLSELFKTSEYKNASDEEKLKMIENVYNEAAKKGKHEYLMKVDEEYASAPDFYALDKSKREKYDDDIDMTKQEWAKALNSLTKEYDKVKSETGRKLSTEEKATILADNGVETLEQAQTFNKNISEKMWNEVMDAKKGGQTFQKMEDEKTKAEEHFNSLNIPESEKDKATAILAKSDGKTVKQDAYDLFVRQVASNNVNNPNKAKRNGTYDTWEIKDAIEKVDKKYGLTKRQKAYLFANVAQSNWKNPYN